MRSPVRGTDRATAYGVSEPGWATGATDNVHLRRGAALPPLPPDRFPGPAVLLGADNVWHQIDSIAHGVSDVRDEAAGRSVAGRVDRPTVWRCAAPSAVPWRMAGSRDLSDAASVTQELVLRPAYQQERH
jgi:hypothetical protein